MPLFFSLPTYIQKVSYARHVTSHDPNTDCVSCVHLWYRGDTIPMCNSIIERGWSCHALFYRYTTTYTYACTNQHRHTYIEAVLFEYKHPLPQHHHSMHTPYPYPFSQYKLWSWHHNISPPTHMHASCTARERHVPPSEWNFKKNGKKFGARILPGSKMYHMRWCFRDWDIACLCMRCVNLYHHHHHHHHHLSAFRREKYGNCAPPEPKNRYPHAGFMFSVRSFTLCDTWRVHVMFVM